MRDWTVNSRGGKACGRKDVSGLNVPGLAGFRHSDPVVIRAHGAERLTYYPRDLESMIGRV